MRRVLLAIASMVVALTLSGCVNITPVDDDSNQPSSDGGVDEMAPAEPEKTDNGIVELDGWKFAIPQNWSAQKSGDTIKFISNDGVTTVTVSFIDSSEAYDAFSDGLGEDLALKTLANAYLQGFKDEGVIVDSEEMDVSDIDALKGAYCEAADIPESSSSGGGVVALCIDRSTSFIGTLTYEKDKYTEADISDVTADFIGIMLGATPPAGYQRDQVSSDVSEGKKASDDSKGEIESEEKESEATVSQNNALATARDYLDYTAFSYDGLVDQLEFEGFSNDDAIWAVDNCGADWNEQAEKKAQDYLDYSSFSRSGLIDQLVFEGFTQEQAEHGADSVGL